MYFTYFYACISRISTLVTVIIVSYVYADKPTYKTVKSLNQMECIVINTSDCSEVLWLDSIVYCTAEGSYSRVFLENQRSVFSSKNLAWFERNLQSIYFVRLHRSYIINLRFISKVYKSEGKVGLKTGEKVPISQSKIKHFWYSLNNISSNNLHAVDI